MVHGVQIGPRPCEARLVLVAPGPAGHGAGSPGGRAEQLGVVVLGLGSELVAERTEAFAPLAGVSLPA